MAKATSDLVETLDGTADELHFVNTRLVRGSYQPKLDQPWHGRERLGRIVAKKFSCTQEAALALIDLAVKNLWSETVDTSVAAERRLQLMRLKDIQTIIFRQLKQKKRTVHYKYTIVEEAGVKKRKKVRDTESVTAHVNPALIGKAIDVEDRISRIQGIAENENTQDLKRMMREQMREAAAQRTGEVTVTDGKPPKARQIIATVHALPAPSAPAPTKSP